LEATEDMIGPHFQGLLYLLADYALQKKSKKIFIDARKFLFHPGSPIPPTNGQNMPDENFPTGFFSSESELRKRLSS
jgi:hypothetical protein